MSLLGTSGLCWLILAGFYWTAPTSIDGQKAGQNPQPHTAPGANQEPRADVSGIWSGTLFSNHSDEGTFTITVVVTRNNEGHLIGNSSLSSGCLQGAKLQISVNGANIVFAGSDEEGDNLTLGGTLDSTGNMLEASYILNASATGKCETDDGKGQLARR
jgi:hypothetical protein